MKSRVISISAISAAFIAIFLFLGAAIEFIDLVSVVFASIFVMLPLYYGSYKGCFLAFLAGGILSLFGGFINIYSLVYPSYFLFFGIFPIIKCYMQDKNIKFPIQYIIGLIWCVAISFGLYFYYVLVAGKILEGLPKFITDNIYWFIALFGIIIYVIYERFIVVLRRFIMYFLSKKLKK